MIDTTSQGKNLFFQKTGNFGQTKQKIYQELIHKITKSYHHKNQLNHKDLKILTSSLSLTYQIKQQEKTKEKKQLLLINFLRIHVEIGDHDSVLTILKNHLSNLQSIPFSVHQKNVFFKQYKSLWVSLTLKNNRFYSVFDTPVRDTHRIRLCLKSIPPRRFFVPRS